MSFQKFDDEFWTPALTAQFLNVSVSWLAKARMRGDGPDYVKFGRAVRYSKNGADRYARSRMHRSTSEYEVREFGRTNTEAQSHKEAGLNKDDESASHGHPQAEE